MKNIELKLICFTFLCLILLLPPPAVAAQEINPLISELKNRYNEKTTIELYFDLDIYWNVREIHEKKKGSLVLAPGDKFRCRIGAAEWISDGHIYWQYNEKTSQVIIRRLLDIDLSMHPSQMLKRFLSYKYTEKTKEGKYVVLTCNEQEENQKRGYQHVSLWVDVRKNTIEKVILIDTDGNESTYTISKTVLGEDVPRTLFTFEVPKGVEVLDTRD